MTHEKINAITITVYGFEKPIVFMHRTPKSKMYSNVTESSLKRAQRAQVALMEIAKLDVCNA